ncbi:MAG: hypothetical protein JKY67_16595 [Pseudomonadales bacterium]|nr:hypothetical protein [Pseudomonadales bacterium]
MRQTFSFLSKLVIAPLLISITCSSYAADDKKFAYLFGQDGEIKTICNNIVFSTSTHAAPPPLGNGKKIFDQCSQKTHPWGPKYSSEYVMILTSKLWVEEQINDTKNSTHKIEEKLTGEIAKLTNEIQDLKKHYALMQKNFEKLINEQRP